MTTNVSRPSFIETSLAGKTVLIVGGTSGIGLAAAVQAKDAGANVIVFGHDRERAGEVAAEHGFAGYGAADVTNAEEFSAALMDVPHVDHLVLLAGSFVAGKVLETDVSHLRRAFDERIWASITAIQALGGRLAPNGTVTLISGALADRPNGFGTAVLAAASAAMEALARGLVLELAPRRINTLSPGPIDTPLLAKTLGDGREAYVERLKNTLPLHRMGTAEEAGAAVVFLMANGWMNGAVLNVDGGSRLV
ncbi:SDR family oxidoreductase [Sphingomonas sp. DT-51]|uniref:SDR family oxidoreductase n=1 Tax=Sphingomonas sp. DT-51 TaxID=3396165 RepID=UPI003F19C800